MRTLKNIALIIALSLFLIPVYANTCCNSMGGVNYCDSSAGRLVCKNGFYSSCYCTRHAVMDLQLLSGCCLWRGGVMSTLDTTGLIFCNDGSVSEECSLQKPEEQIATY